MTPPRTYRCDLAWLPDSRGGGRLASDVLLEVDQGIFSRVEAGADDVPATRRLRGLVLPGAANAHSHAFHRALRGRTHGQQGTFWTWRERMYEVAGRLDPDTYRDLARAVYAEMALAGYTSVGEFHYLHRDRDGRAYQDPNEMGHVLIEAARDAGIRICLLDTCYLAGGIGEPLTGVQRRFDDGSAEAWADRVEGLAAVYGKDHEVRVGAALHSVRAVPRDQMPGVAAWALHHAAPLHAHLSEQPAENDACYEAYGCTPTQLLADAGVLGERTTVVHATHLEHADVVALGRTRTFACLCPTTERELADGVGPAHRLADAGVRLTLGSDSHAVIDPFEEARAVELDLRLATRRRGHLDTAELLRALGPDGQACLGFADAGRITQGARADLVAVRLDSVRTAGLSGRHAADGVVFAATAADVTDVIIDGKEVVRDGVHQLGEVARMLEDAIYAVVRGR